MSKRVSDADINSQNKRARRSEEYEESRDSEEITSSVIQDNDSENEADFSTPTAVCADEFDQLDAQELKLKSRVEKLLSTASSNEARAEFLAILKTVYTSDGLVDMKKLRPLFTVLIEYLCNVNAKNLDEQLVFQISSFLTVQIEYLPPKYLKHVVDLFTSHMESKRAFHERCLEFFVEVFNYVQMAPVSERDAITEQRIGKEYLKQKLAEINSFKWTPACALNILGAFKNIALDANIFKLIVEKLFNLQEIKWPVLNIPTVIQTVFSFSAAKLNRSSLLERVLAFFAELHKDPSCDTTKNDFLEAQNESLSHIIHLVKTDQSTSRDLIKIFKVKMVANLVDLVQPFSFALMLSLVKILPKQDGVLRILKQSIISIYQAEMKWKKYNWIEKALETDEKNLREKLLKPSKCRIFATETTMPGLIDLVFELLDTNGVRMSRASRATTLDEHVTVYAVAIIRDLFRFFPSSRDEILQQLTERIFSNGLAKSALYIDQLSILILSEPASSFQDYLKKFKGRLIHMISLTPAVASEFLNSIKQLLKYDSAYKDTLVATLKKSVYQSNLEIRKVGLNGLLFLLTSTKVQTYLPSSQASQSMSLSQTQSQVSRMSMSQEKFNETICLEVFFSLRRCLNQQPEIRAKLYQSTYSIVSQNPTLIGPTLNLLLVQLENYLIKHDLLTIFNLAKCVKLDENQEIELSEPIDILMHAVSLCNQKYLQMETDGKCADILDEDIKKHSDTIGTYIANLKQTVAGQSMQYMHDTYKAQVASMVLTTKKPGNVTMAGTQAMGTQNLLRTTQKPTTQNPAPSNPMSDLTKLSALYQCLLGSLEAMIEYFYSNNLYQDAQDVFKKYNQLSAVIQKEFVPQVQTPKKKPPRPAKKPKGKGKKDKENQSPEIEMEDEEIKATAADNTNMLDLTENESNPVLESTLNQMKKSTAPRAKKPVLPKFQYTHRITFNCLLKMLQDYFKKSMDSTAEVSNNQILLDEFVTHMKIDVDYHDYLVQVLTNQLDMLLTVAENNTTKSAVPLYDPESLSEKDQFKYLLQIWNIFWYQMELLKCPSENCTDTDRFCEVCIKYRLTYIRILSQIWKIVTKKFNLKLNDLFTTSILEEMNASMASQNTSNVAVSILDCCRRYVDKCISTQFQSVHSAAKLGAQIFDLMYDIGQSVSLKPNDFVVLFQWIQGIAINNDQTITDSSYVKSLIKFFVFVTWNKNSSSAFMKYISHDMLLYYGSKASSLSETVDEQTFAIYNHDNMQIILNLVFEELNAQLELFEWLIKLKQDLNSTRLLTKQVTFVIDSIQCLLDLDAPCGAIEELLLRTLSKFYNFMILFTKTLGSRTLVEAEEKILKHLVDSTAKQLQTRLNQLLGYIQNSKSKGGPDKQDKKAGKAKGKGKEAEAGNPKLKKCAKMIPNFVFLVENYEQQLKILNKKFETKGIDLTQHYQTCLRDFRIDLTATSKSNETVISDEDASSSAESDDDDEVNETRQRRGAARSQAEEAEEEEESGEEIEEIEDDDGDISELAEAGLA